MAKILMLSPHCDDIPLSLGGSLRAREWGEEVHAIVIFSLSRYTLKNGWNNDVEAATDVRNAEERDAAARAGYTVEFLGFPEPGVRSGYTQITDIFDPTLPFETDPIWTSLHERLLEVLQEHEGIAVSPLGIGNHIDHRMVAACFREAAASNRKLIPTFYEDLPYAARVSSQEIRRLVRAHPAQAPLAPRLFARGQLAEKIRLLDTYGSQLSQDDYDSVVAHWECRGRGELVWWSEAGDQGWS